MVYILAIGIYKRYGRIVLEYRIMFRRENNISEEIR